MDPTFSVVAVISRFTHIASMVFLLGSGIYGWLVVAPALRSAGEAERERLSDHLAMLVKGWNLLAVVLILASGTYNLLNKPAMPRTYHMWFGIKTLLALHVFATVFLLGRPGVPSGKRSRLAAGVVVSGLGILLISAYLRTVK